MRDVFSSLPIALLSLAVFLSGCGRTSDRPSADGETVRPVLYHEVLAADGVRTRSFPARITAADLRELSFTVPGVVQSVWVRESEKVSAGQLLAELDLRDYESGLAAVAARVENAQQELDRARRLFEQDAIARSILEQRETVARVAQSEFEAAQKALADGRIVAPFDGVVSRVLIEVAQTVGPGAPAIRMFSRDMLEATIAVPASLVVNADGSRREKLGALIRLDADRATAIPADFKKAEMEADASSQSFAATFGFQAPEGLMVLPGMNAEVELKLGAGQAPANLIQVPLRAVVSEGGRHFVWVVDVSAEPHRVALREVVLSAGIGESIPVEAGLVAGETIVAAGVSGLVEGLAVRRWDRGGD